MKVEPRSTWTNAEMTAPTRTPTPYQGVAVHWPGAKILAVGKSHAKHLRSYRAIERYEMGSKGYGAIAYQVLVCPCGILTEGRTRARVNGANGDVSANTRFGSALALLGVGEKPTDAMLEGLRAAPDYLNTPLKLYTHNQVRPDPTACPGPDLTKWIKAGYPAPKEDDVSAKDVWDYQISTADGDVKAQQLLRRTDRRVKAIVDLIKAEHGTDQAAVEAALREVLGSLDD